MAGWSNWQTIAAQMVSGGIMESLQGGNFGNGFFAAGLTALAMPRVGKIDNNIGRTITGALVGGTISEATGGKFANGAVSGAMQAAMAGPEQSPEEIGNGTGGSGETHIPEHIAIEECGFETRDAAAKAFGGRYYNKSKMAEYITGIVKVDDGWGYLTPGKGPDGVGSPRIGKLLEAYSSAGFNPAAFAHTHAYGRIFFSSTDVQSLMRSGGNGEWYVTNWNNETYAMNSATVIASMHMQGFRFPSQIRDFVRNIPIEGYQGRRVP